MRSEHAAQLTFHRGDPTGSEKTSLPEAPRHLKTMAKAKAFPLLWVPHPNPTSRLPLPDEALLCAGSRWRHSAKAPVPPTAHPPTSQDQSPHASEAGAGAPVSPAGAAGARQRDVLQVGELHEGPVEVVQLQDAGEQEEARDEDAGEELGHAELLQAQVPQPAEGAPSAPPGPAVPDAEPWA